MDLQSFAEDDFESKKWINKAWSSCGNQEKEVFVTNTVSRLQLYMKQLSNSLDETTTQILTSIPRVLQDASALQLEGSLLQQRLLSLEEKVQGVEEQTGQSIQSLQRIDQLKGRLENAAASLREADKWAALVTSLETILENGVSTQKEKLDELTELVSSMSSSLDVLSEAPDYDRKRLQLETLFNRLEATLTPPLLEGLTQMNSDRSATYVKIFTCMRRGAAACRCGRRAAAARFAAAWAALDTHTYAGCLRMLSAEAVKQVEWFSEVLKSEKPIAEVVRLYTDLLLSLDPNPSKVVSAKLKMCSDADEGISLLIELKMDIDSFVNNINAIMETPKYANEKVEASTLRQLGRALYSPLRDSLPTYTQFQTKAFLDLLKNHYLKQEDLLEHSKMLLSVAEQCKGWFSSSASKGKKIAGDCIQPFFSQALEAFVTELTSHITTHARRIEVSFLSAVSARLTTGVLSIEFPAALALESAVSTLLDALANRFNTKPVELSTSPLTDLPMLLDARERSSSSDSSTSSSALRRSKEHLKSLARTILRHPVDAQLDKIPQLSVWNNNDELSTDLPDFALSPQEYITEIGQYLMTLPQHLELHLSDKQAPLQYLSEICNHTCEAYSGKVLNIRNMDALGTKRCLTDIVYLSSVVEDLGSNVTPALKNLEKSLRSATAVKTE